MLCFVSYGVTFVYLGLSMSVWCKFGNCVVCCGVNHCLGQVCELLVVVVHYDASLYIVGQLKNL